MTTAQQWFGTILRALNAPATEEELRDHLAAEDARTQALLVQGPLDAGLVRHLYAQRDPLGLVLRSRLYLEDSLDAVVAKKFKHAEVLLGGRPFSVSVKTDLLRAANHLDEKTYRDILLLSRLRNGFAHHLSSDIAEYDLSAFSYCARLQAVTRKFEGREARERINVFLLRQIVFQLLLRLTTRHKLTRQAGLSV